ncbi:hypothetical protein DB346_18545 [Verrucomicrobia bacterium LW23]|nr:hypothetical protein DB346_18545 [Verrucomicrobia bacterium LW23]
MSTSTVDNRLESEASISANILHAEAVKLEADIERMCRERDELTAEIDAARAEHARLTRLHREKMEHVNV